MAAAADPSPVPSVALTHPERIVFPEQQVTKRDLADYYMKVADWMLPHLSQRVLTLVRCPEGRDKECFYQKHAMRGMPPHIHTVAVHEKQPDRSADYMTVDGVLGLVSLVQLGVLEIHTWGCHADRLDRPDQLVFDLDPGSGVQWQRVVEGARHVRDFLDELGLESFVKTSGGKGLHVVLPVERRLDWDATRDFCKGVAEALSAESPERYVATADKAKRRGRIFIDYLRNARGATNVCAFSTRARPRAPVSAPLTWHELESIACSDAYDIQSMPRRLAALESDPWKDFFELRQSITKPMRRAVGC